VSLQPANDVRPINAVATEYFLPRMAQEHPDLWPRTAARRTWVANSFILYFLILLLIVQNIFPWMQFQATFEAIRMGQRAKTTRVDGKTDYVVKDGKTEFHQPQLTVTTSGYGPAWDTFALMGLWFWCGVQMLRQREKTGVRLPADSPASEGALSSIG
jgi:hypothetical protein